MNGAFCVSGGRAALQRRESETPNPVFLSESAGANATKGESKDPENSHVLNADSGSSHKAVLLLGSLN
jgi:hypothetical protein